MRIVAQGNNCFFRVSRFSLSRIFSRVEYRGKWRTRYARCRARGVSPSAILILSPAKHAFLFFFFFATSYIWITVNCQDEQYFGRILGSRGYQLFAFSDRFLFLSTVNHWTERTKNLGAIFFSSVRVSLCLRVELCPMTYEAHAHTARVVIVRDVRGVPRRPCCFYDLSMYLSNRLRRNVSSQARRKWRFFRPSVF